MDLKGQNLFFTLQYSHGEGYSLPYMGDLSQIFPQSVSKDFSENPERFLDLIRTENKSAFISDFEKALKAGVSFEETVRLDFDGKIIAARFILSSRKSEDPYKLWDGLISFVGINPFAHMKSLLKGIIRQSPIPISLISPEGSVLLFNESASRILGVDFDSVNTDGLNYFEMAKPWIFTDENGRIVAPDNMPVFRVLKDCNHYSKVLQVTNSDGTRRWLQVDASPVFNDRAELIGVLILFPEITVQKNTEMALQQQIRELDCLYKLSHLTDQNNLSIEDLLRQSLGIMLKSWKFPHMINIRIEYLDKVYSGNVEKLQSGEPDFCQKSNIFVYGKNSGYIGVCYSSQRVFDDIFLANRELKLLNDMAGRLGRIIEKKQSERALMESEARFRHYIESAPDGIFLADGQGCFVDVNEAACRITGYSREELLGMPLSNLTYHEDIESTRESFGRVKSQGRTTNICRYTMKNGEVRHWIVDAVKLDDNSFLGFNRDITAQKIMEEQLRQMEKMDAIGQLAGGIAHDFNNQIAVIMGYSEMLVSELKDQKLLKFARNILAGAHRSDDLTRKLLAFAHKGLYETKIVNMHKVIGEAVDILTYSLDRKISVKLDLKANDPFTAGDPSQIQNMLINLAINARDAMPDGGVLTFSTANRILDEQFCSGIPYEVRPGEFVTVSVSDTGIGMNKAVMSRIFEPFFTTKSIGKGTGMGLASVYGAVSNHKAVINVDSSPGEGTTFLLSFPVEKKVDPMSVSYVSPEIIRGNARILLVDDEELIRSMAKEVLESLGYHVISFSDGANAIDYLTHNPGRIDLVILDMIMPGMGGKDVYRNIRELDNGIPVILSSGFSLSGEVQQLLDEGASAFVSKPYEIGAFSSAVSAALGNK